MAHQGETLVTISKLWAKAWVARFTAPLARSLAPAWVALVE
jgi:hypothetical protein